MTTYNHAYTLGFSVPSSRTPDGRDVTPAMLRHALLHRIIELDAQATWHEAVGAPFDSYEETPAQQSSRTEAAEPGYTHCARCQQEWPRAAVPQISVDMGTPRQRRMEGCDNCGTDAHLVDTEQPLFTPA